jgi:hypothetical protein
MVVGAVAVSVMLAGCVMSPRPAPSKGSKQMQQIAIEQSRVQMVAHLDAAQKIVGGSWEDEDGGAEVCTTPSGEAGATFQLMRSGPPVPLAQQQTMVDAVSKLWAKAGYSGVQSAQFIKDAEGIALDYPKQFGTAPDGTHLTFAVSVGGSYVVGQTPCVAGDADAYDAAHHPDN